MRLYKIIGDSAAVLMLMSGLIVAPFAVFTHDCITCPAPCCSDEEDGCCDNQAASCAEHPLCDDCALFSVQNAVLAESVFDGFIRSNGTAKYPIQKHLNSARAFQGRRMVSADFSGITFHSFPHLTSMVLRI